LYYVLFVNKQTSRFFGNNIPTPTPKHYAKLDAVLNKVVAAADPYVVIKDNHIAMDKNGFKVYIIVNSDSFIFLPLDETKMIEALSDSTIYMAFYTIKHLIEKTEIFDLTDEFFDYVFLGKGESKDEVWTTCRDSFEYWYPVDSRHSGADLIRNHLTVFIFTHVALFDKKFWPKQIATNGFVLMDGMKMSKSMGNILPLRKAISEFGADIVRFSVVAGAEISSDTDFNRSVAIGMKSKLEFISKLVSESSSPIPIGSRMDDWILSRLNRKIAQMDTLYSTLSLRELSLVLFYDIISDLQWYVKRNKRHNLREFFKKWTILISPIMPHIAEEFNSILGNEELASFSKFPESETSLIKENVELGEELVQSLISDIERVSKLIGKKPTRIKLIVADSWKRDLFEIAKETKTFEGILKNASTKGLPMKDAPTIVKSLMKNIHSLPKILDSNEEYLALMDASSFLGDEFGAKVEVYHEKESTEAKAKNAMPSKPAIILE
jgi:leucyl-tRNA synthetase